MNQTQEYYTIDADKLDRITRIVREDLPNVTDAKVREYLLADWAEGQEHQTWLDNAADADIADWLVRSLRGMEVDYD